MGKTLNKYGVDFTDGKPKYIDEALASKFLASPYLSEYKEKPKPKKKAPKKVSKNVENES